MVHERICLLLDLSNRPSFLLNLHLALAPSNVALGLGSKLSLELFYFFDKLSLGKLNGRHLFPFKQGRLVVLPDRTRKFLIYHRLIPL